jgi:uncharacterized protein
MKGSGSGGTEGGVGLFLSGFTLALLSTYLFFDSIQVTTGGAGFVSRSVIGWTGGFMGGTTTSMGVIFVPFIISVIALFYDAKQNWAWLLFWIGLVIVAVEVLSTLRFHTQMKASTLMLFLGMFAAGIGLMLRSYRPVVAAKEEPKNPAPAQPDGAASSAKAESGR